MAKLELTDILNDISKTRKARRDSVQAPFTPLGKRAWRKRERWKKEREDKEFEREHNARKAKRRANQKYYYENREVLNEKRRLNQHTPPNAFNRAKRKAVARGQEWRLTFDEWWAIWSDEDTKFLDPSDGFVKQAWKLRGSNPKTCTQMKRKDTNGKWEASNCYISYRDQ
jgi:hypothetical protein